jgi:HD-GYP domain-containing protein (c-di-GMP phosphodiesterase class II)
MRVNKIYMMRIEGRAIELGSIPFNLYVRDHKDQLVLFCRAGMPILAEHKEIIERRNSEFYVTSEEINQYLDYTMERMSTVIQSPAIRVTDKVRIIRDLGRRVVEQLLEDPRSGRHVTNTRRFVRTTVEFIIACPEVNLSLFNISDLKTYLFSHAINTSVFCLLIGRQILGDNRQMLINLGMGGLLLDIGMSRLDSGIYTKPGRLEEEDWQSIRKHTRLGYDMLKDHEVDETVLEMILHHHERLDGSGYPNGLSGEELPLPARIAAIADVYDAMTSERDYRPALMHVQALTEIAGLRSAFDQAVFRALLEVVLQNEEIINTFLARHRPDLLGNAVS